MSVKRAWDLVKVILSVKGNKVSYKAPKNLAKGKGPVVF